MAAKKVTKNKKSGALVGACKLSAYCEQAIFFQKDPKWTFRNFKKEKALKTLLKSSFMQNFSSSTHFFKKISRFFRKPRKRISKNSKFEYAISYLNYQSMSMQKFSSLACTQTDLDNFLTIFEENFMIFQENS
jgi:hypothetical protein